MTRDEIKARVIDIVAEQISVSKDQVKEESSFVDDLGADSLDVAELGLEFEDEFDISIPDDPEQIRTVGQVIDYIEKAAAGS